MPKAIGAPKQFRDEKGQLNYAIPVYDSSGNVELQKLLSEGLAGGLSEFGQISKKELQMVRNMLGVDAPGADIRDLLLGTEDPRTIEMMIEGDNVSEENAALGMAKLQAIEEYGTGAGRIEEYADGALEWVPEGMATSSGSASGYMIRESQTIATRYPRNLPDEAEDVPPQHERHQALIQESFDDLGIQPMKGMDPRLMEQLRESLQQETQQQGRDWFANQYGNEQGFQEGGLSAVTGVGEPKMKEDEDQPLVPKPGNLISRTLARIRKAFGYARPGFGFAEGGLVRYAQGGPVKLANGGLAAVAGYGEDEDEGEDDAAVSSRSLVQQSLKSARMNTKQALQRLEAGREALLAQKRDKSAMWLRFAQGMLAPTKTGGFGESVGRTAGLMAEEKEEGREFELSREERLLEIESEMAEQKQELVESELQGARTLRDMAKGQHMPGSVIGNPRSMFVVGPGGKENALGIGIVRIDEDGNPYMHQLPDKDGNPVTTPDRLDAETQRLIALAKARGGLEAEDVEKKVQQAYTNREKYGRALYGLDLIDAITPEGGTSGMAAIIQEARQFFGDDAKDVTDRGTLMNLMADQLFSSLAHFGTQINAKELGIARSVSGGVERTTNINRSLLQILVKEVEFQMQNARDYAREWGDPRQRALMEMPIPNYGITGSGLDRVRKAGFTMEEFQPFEDQAAEVEETIGSTMKNPMIIDAPSATYEPSYDEVPRDKWFKIRLPDGTVMDKQVWRQN